MAAIRKAGAERRHSRYVSGSRAERVSQPEAARQIPGGQRYFHLHKDTPTSPKKPARLISDGEDLDWKTYVPEETVTLLRSLIARFGTESFAPVIEAADGNASYGQARIVAAVVEVENTHARTVE